MFLTTRKSRHQRKAAEAEAAAARHRAAARMMEAAKLLEKVGPATTQARESAALAAGSAREWASPRLGRARARGIEVAAPRVEAAAEALAPRVDAARDKIVEEMLPRLVAAVTAAAAAAAVKTEAAHDRSLAALAETGQAARRSRHVETAQPSHKVRNAALLATLLAALAAGFAAWKRSQPAEDPWAAGTGESSSSGTATGDRLSGGDTAGGLGSGVLASESTDVSTPTPDGVTAAQAEEALGPDDATNTGTFDVPSVRTEDQTSEAQADEGQDEGGTTPRP